jgi:hypothetical protein
MSEPPADDSETERLRRTAQAFAYPPTPDLAAAVRERLTARRPRRTRRLGWALAVAALAILALLAVPEVRAGVGRLLRIGAVEIVPAASPSGSIVASAQPDETSAPAPAAKPNQMLLRLRGATTLEGARQRMPFAIKLPRAPADLGPPDRVFVQELGDGAAILVWTEPDQPEQVRLALYQLPSDAMIRKLEPRVIAETTVSGQRALWTEGPYLLEFRNSFEPLASRLVTGNVLIWTRDGVTYRLESALSMEEAITIAESLR